MISIQKLLKNLLVRVACMTILKPKNTDRIYQNARIIKCRPEDADLLMNSTNNVLRLHLDNEVLYFRECKQHTRIEDYVRNQIDVYYAYYAPEQCEDKKVVLKSLSSKKNFRKFVNMGMTNDPFSGAYRFCMGQGGVHIGLEPETPEQEDRLKQLVQFMWGDLYGYMLNSGVKIGNYQIYNAVRSIATYRMAKLLNLERLIPHTEFAILYIDGMPSLFGTVMTQAHGVCVEHSSPTERENMVSPVLQRDLMALNCLDALCLEKDHRLGNYNVILDCGKACGISAFDNDSPKSFSIGGISFTTYKDCAPLVKNGKLNRPFVDTSFEISLNHICAKQIFAEMKDYLNIWQLVALWLRIKKLKKVLRRISPERKLNECDWSYEMIGIELSGDYGKTYLMHFVEEQEHLYQPWIKSNIMGSKQHMKRG